MTTVDQQTDTEAPSSITTTTDDHGQPLLRVAGGTNVKDLASAISREITAPGASSVVLRAIGAGAVNQAVKAVALARAQAAPQGYNLYVIPGFATVQGGSGDPMSAIILRVMWS